MKALKFLVLALGVAAFSGCSTITQSDTQSLALTASYQGRAVEADCKLVNDRGSWEAKSPANVPVRKSGEDLDVTCKKEGLPDGLLKAISRAAGSMYGNIVFGGGIPRYRWGGATNDGGSGRAALDRLAIELGGVFPPELSLKVSGGALQVVRETKQGE